MSLHPAESVIIIESLKCGVNQLQIVGKYVTFNG